MGLRPNDSGRSKFAIPALPLPLPLRGYMKITEFRDYLACPYRYALGRLLGLEACDAASFELDPMQFGNLAHEVLCAFGADESINRSDHRDQIERYLLRALQARVDQHYGALLLPAVRIQLARLEQRLKSFAGLQAQLAEEGWEIRFCELSFQREIALDIPGDDPMPLWGKIDRIDYHASSGTWRIIDYKTSEAAGSPHQAHHKREVLKDASELQWHDLQLPLYRLLATRSVHNIQGEIELAYICLPKQADGAAVKLAEWTQDHLDHAFETARAVVRNIRAQKFAINRDYDGPADHYARICQTMTFAEREPAEAEA
jgi:RecB family exonuclease